ncbi:DNA translocase FtsK 4TM domain-containing protein [Acuticoccus sp. MNP-M23]|uniref:DNA translocase FtsK n=1 Tax=Acuticoccus sp. MNP-M23 TaxID=3072793 RepID=UPI002815F8D5|nr:DNA translocase FtsK 4TM domain-containing protein [Acuticoccus sp. MNP-M23]WMS43242.1 DNA translocase FtsK 4TM domain-containing protein [Acuticoccus sp. MNP-M23]
MEHFFDDPSVLFARRAIAAIAGGLLLALTAFLGLALATWTVSDPSLTHATSAPVDNLMGIPGASLADPIMQMLGLAAPLLLAPLPLWGLRLLNGRPLGLRASRLLPGLAAVLLAPGFFNAFPVTSSWPLPMGLGGVIGEMWGAILVNWFGITSGTVHGLFGGVLGLAALFALLRAVQPVRAAPRTTSPGFQIRRHQPAEDEYGLDDTDAFEADTPRLSAFRGALAHATLTVRAKMRRKPRAQHAEAPRLRTALTATYDDEGEGAAVYRTRTTAGEEDLFEAAEPFGEYYDEADGAFVEPAPQPVRQRVARPRPQKVEPQLAPAYAAEAPDQYEAAPEPPAPQRRRVAAAAPFAEADRGSRQFTAPLRGPAARVRALETDEAGNEIEAYDDVQDEAETDTPVPEAEIYDDAAYEDETPETTAAGTADFDDYDDYDDDPFAAEVARHDTPRQNVPVAPHRPARAPAPVPQRAQQQVPKRFPVSEDDGPSGRVTPAAGAMAPGRRVVREAQPSLLPNGEYEFPPLALLAAPPSDNTDTELTEDALEANARVLEGVLEDFGVRGSIIQVRPGPVVTLYELEPAPGIKSSRVIGLADDIARSMSAISARVAVIPGKNAIGIELPNRKRVTVFLRELLASRDFEKTKAKLPMCLGKTIGGEAVIADLARMPHLLVAGTTGSGKSVSVNTMILSLLYFHKPETCRLILIDPKMLELSIYEGIPHLLTEVVTDPKKAVAALKWAVREMEDRYRKMAKLGVRNIDGFNARLKEAGKEGAPLSRIVQTGFDKRTGEAIFEEEVLSMEQMPYIVVIVDEMADLMLVAGKEIEGAIQRLAQMARAAGIHIIMATQRPSVDVITGTIKANFPTRVSFQVTSKIDSRTILGEMGAEQLLGMGDMLFMAGGGRIQRVHGPFVADEEVEDIVGHLKLQGQPEYMNEVLEDDDDEGENSGSSGLDALSESDDLYDRAVALVLRDRKASTSYVQRRLSIGYNRAATLIERMENEGVVSPANNAGKRDILVPAEGEVA